LTGADRNSLRRSIGHLPKLPELQPGKKKKKSKGPPTQELPKNARKVERYRNSCSIWRLVKANGVVRGKR